MPGWPQRPTGLEDYRILLHNKKDYCEEPYFCICQNVVAPVTRVRVLMSIPRPKCSPARQLLHLDNILSHGNGLIKCQANLRSQYGGVGTSARALDEKQQQR
ncbi:15051_t:CDS:2 [Acaulospora morrowiae]|uniref:15051_t:CDS:1 n=1 Tax=Acaulospora morrowiae TaxID=94023 RepID=A0A9N9FU10_9GLOM|nr:15051_t:CDS:2 [Acaulospora morrowiae]